MGTVQGRPVGKGARVGVLMRALWKWVTDRWPVYPLRDLLLREDIPGGASFAYTLGGSILLILTLQVVSGILQLLYYVPTVDHAYNSVSYLRTEVPFGWLIHNMHYWGAQAMVFLVVLHVMRVYIWGAYKKTPLTWFIGVALLLVTMAMSLSGAPLIWDQAGYWAGEVSSSVAGEVPLIGAIQKIILLGGETMGQLALSRFFTFHIWVLAPLLFLLIGAHIAAFRTSGVGGPWAEEKRRRTGPFWPDQAFRDLLVGTAVLFSILTLSVFVPVAFTGSADTLNTSYIPKPEWNFLFLYQALKYFEGPWEPIGAAAIPTFFIVLLLAVPIIDRHPERNPFRRPVAMACLAAYVGVLALLSIIGYLSPGVAQMQAAIPASSRQSSSPPSQDKPVKTENLGQLSFGAARGEELFQSHGCVGCHKVHGRGGSVGPELSGDTLKDRSRQWLIDQIRNPASHFPNSIMPSFKGLSNEQLGNLVSYLMSLAQGSSADTSHMGARKGSQEQYGGEAAGGARKTALQYAPAGSQSLPSEEEALGEAAGKAAFIIGSAENGASLFKDECVSCHGHEGKGGVLNPGSDDGTVPPLDPIDRKLYDKDPKVFAANIDKLIQHGAVPEGPHPALHMPAWGDSRSLTQQKIANLEAYILKLNGVDRGQLVHPGMEPKSFYLLAVIVYGLVMLLLAGIWNKRSGKSKGDAK
jgi:ubiquinol-cytochrome c reductase cytochrome b subunit